MGRSSLLEMGRFGLVFEREMWEEITIGRA